MFQSEVLSDAFKESVPGAIFRRRDLLVRQKTLLIHALRGPLTEYGWVVAKGVARVKMLMDLVEDPHCPLPEADGQILEVLIVSHKGSDGKLSLLDVEITKRAKEDQLGRWLMSIPGIGPITATRSSRWRRRRIASQRGASWLLGWA